MSWTSIVLLDWGLWLNFLSLLYTKVSFKMGTDIFYRFSYYNTDNFNKWSHLSQLSSKWISLFMIKNFLLCQQEKFKGTVNDFCQKKGQKHPKIAGDVAIISLLTFHYPIEKTFHILFDVKIQWNERKGEIHISSKLNHLWCDTQKKSLFWVWLVGGSRMDLGSAVLED